MRTKEPFLSFTPVLEINILYTFATIEIKCWLFSASNFEIQSAVKENRYSTLSLIMW